MNSSSIFEIAMNCPPGLSHPRLTESNAWVDALLEEICREEEERFCGRDLEQVSVLGKRERAESDISDYEEEIDNVVSRYLTQTVTFDINIEEENYWDIMDKMEAGLLKEYLY
jgi:hypothetical protein